VRLHVPPRPAGRVGIRYRGIERRKFRRLQTPVVVRFGLLGEASREGTALLGRTRDVSAEGLCLETNTVIQDRLHVLAEAMGREGRLSMAVTLPDKEEPFEVLGRVVWYDLAPDDSESRFRAGVLFIEMGQESRKRWGDFVSAMKKKRSG
jgi:hypothetical protein